ncbi:MAG: phosphatidylcholine/phosphatidylserine synthase [Kiritimatiellae bacterium]|jgi:CDP-diacylglycerol--serine O-phosphatidyltransferase|nr:phosphatidylcholine/phosphatidylserine synthase [Kiritimatiellia bacterium]
MKKIKFRRPYRRPRMRKIPIRAMIPNMVTLMAAASGITSIQYSSQGNWRFAIFAIFAACMLDGLDGRVARMLNASSKLGAELDSLSDFVSFGVAPALFTYYWIMEPIAAGSTAESYKGLYWALSLFYAMCGGFRLARFNIMIDDENRRSYWNNFFTGLPSPGAAGLLLTPAIWQIHTGYAGLQNPVVGCVMLVSMGVLMACPLPTFCAKAIHIKVKYLPPFLLVAMFTIGMLISQFWLTLGVIGLVYFSSIPVCFVAFWRMKRQYEAERSPAKVSV